MLKLLSKPIECTILRMNPKIKVWNLGDMMCQWMFLHSEEKKCTMLVNDIDQWGSLCMCGGQAIHGKSLFFLTVLL